MVRCKNRIPYWIDWRLTGLAEPDYGATISFGLPIEPEDSQYGKYRIKGGGLQLRDSSVGHTERNIRCDLRAASTANDLGLL